jgi:hypothetical protein
MTSEANPNLNAIPEPWVRKAIGLEETKRWPMVLETVSGRYVGSLFIAEEEDARVIAASTVLLAACREALSAIPEKSPVRAKVRAAIRKAKGESTP